MSRLEKLAETYALDFRGMKELRIFVGLIEIAGYYSNLKKGFDELGVKCDFYRKGIHPFRYNPKADNLFQTALNWISRKSRRSRPGNSLEKHLLFLLECTVLCSLFLYSVFRYNVFIFGFETCFFPFLKFFDLRILRMLGKRIIFVYHGSDSRPPYIDGTVASGKNPQNSLLPKKARRQKMDMRTVEHFADVLIDHPLSSHFHEREFVKYLSIGIPSASDGVQSQKVEVGGEVIVLHCPSDIKAKGTPIIRAAVLALKQKGYRIDYREISGKPNYVVRDALKSCHFVVDQVFTDTPMPTFVAEAAMYRRPAVISGYCVEWVKETLVKDTIPPSHLCRPEEIREAIEKLVVHESYRNELGERAYDFVSSLWSPRNVAERFIRLIEDDVPESWFYDPRNIRYLNGACISEERCKAAVRSIIESGGVKCLQLRDKPELERLFFDFAYS